MQNQTLLTPPRLDPGGLGPWSAKQTDKDLERGGVVRCWQGGQTGEPMLLMLTASGKQKNHRLSAEKGT